MQFVRARSLFLLGVIAVAVPLLRAQAMAKRADSSTLKEAGEAFRAGSAAYQRNDLRTAHAEFAKLVRLAPHVAAGHAAYGTVLLAEGNARAAAVQLEEAHRLDPHDANAVLSLAMVEEQLREYAKSVEMFQLFDRMKSEASFTPEAAIAYATSLSATGHTADAQKQIEAALAASPNDAALHDTLGTLLAQQQKYDEGASHFQTAIQLEPSLASAHYHLGSVLLNQNHPDAAVKELTEANTLTQENNADYAVQLGRALRADNQDEQAVAVLRHALTLAPASIDLKYELALALQSNGNARESQPLFKQVAAARPKDSDALTNLGLALVQTGNAKEAIPYYNRAMALNAKSATLREDLGVAYLQQSDLSHAMEQFRAGIALAPDNPQIHYDLGLALKLKDEPAAAIPEFEQAGKLDPELPDPPYTLGVLYMQLGRFADAETALERATSLRPDNGQAWAILGSVYKETNNFDKAVAALRRAIELLPTQPSPHITLAAILSQQGDHAGAVAERKTAAELSRIAVSRQRANFALDSGRALLKKGQLAEALAQLQTAVAADPNYADAHLALAEALDREGEHAAAALERQKAEQIASSTEASPAHP